MKVVRIDENWGKQIINGWANGRHVFHKIVTGLGWEENEKEAKKIAKEWMED